MARVEDCRTLAARLIGAEANEIALLGPTSLGLSLVARGLPWEPGDEVVYYGDDYPANVYPWRALISCGVKAVALKPEHPGVITWDLVEAALTPKTKLVSLASCHFLSGYRPDIDGIGAKLHERGVLFCVDAIQTLGAFPFTTRNVDFLAADSHKWLLGPAGAGIFYVGAHVQEMLIPALLGSLNVTSPNFIAQEELVYVDGARRYEPGCMNLVGICGMHASMQLLLEIGVDEIGLRLLNLRRYFLERARALGYQLMLEEWDTSDAASRNHRSGIITLCHPEHDMETVGQRLIDNSIRVSLRHNRAGNAFIRFSPHFYCTEPELDQALEQME
jgi:selenocysteine lyase/cysteine desulfurase